jgi:hypothetical protein
VTRGLTALTIAALSLMVVVEVSRPGSDLSPKAFGIISVLFLLGTISLPLLRGLQAGDRELAGGDPRPTGGHRTADILYYGFLEDRQGHRTTRIIGVPGSARSFSGPARTSRARSGLAGSGSRAALP